MDRKMKLKHFLLFLIFLAACHSQVPAKTSRQVPPAPTSASGLSPVYFEVDQADIKDEGVINQNARWLKANQNKVVVLEGHCDERGDRQYNVSLGDRRARNVMAALMSRGISENQLIIVSYGKDKPLTHNKAELNKNRRVEFVIR